MDFDSYRSAKRAKASPRPNFVSWETSPAPVKRRAFGTAKKPAAAKVAEGHFADVEQARKEAQAVAGKLKENIAQLQADNAKLSEQVTTFTIKVRRNLDLVGGAIANRWVFSLADCLRRKYRPATHTRI